MNARTKPLPSELPEKPTGWKKRQTLHLNFGREGGVGCYVVLDANGDETPIGHHYDTRKGGQTGFSLPGVNGLMTWAELRAAWPAFVESQMEVPHG